MACFTLFYATIYMTIEYVYYVNNYYLNLIQFRFTSLELSSLLRQDLVKVVQPRVLMSSVLDKELRTQQLCCYNRDVATLV